MALDITSTGPVLHMLDKNSVGSIVYICKQAPTTESVVCGKNEVWLIQSLWTDVF